MRRPFFLLLVVAPLVCGCRPAGGPASPKPAAEAIAELGGEVDLREGEAGFPPSLMVNLRGVTAADAALARL